MAIAGTLEIQLLAGIARLQQDMDQARSAVGGAMSSISRSIDVAKDAFAKLAGVVSAGMFAKMIKDSIDMVDGLKDLSKQTGVSVEALAGVRLAAQQSGAELEGVAASISKLSQNIGKEGEKFRALGITAKEPLEAFKQLADIFASIEDPQQRAAFGAAALGKSWATAAPLLSEGSEKISEMVKRGTELSGVTQKMADDADDLNDKLAELQTTIGGAGSGLVNQIASGMLPLLIAVAEDAREASKETVKMGSSLDLFSEALRAVIILGGNVIFVLKAMGNELGGLGAQFAATARAQLALFTGDFKGAISEIRSAFGSGGIGDMMTKDAEESRKAFDVWEQKMLAVGTAASAVKLTVREVDNELEKVAAKAAEAAEIAARVAAFLADQENKKKSDSALKKSEEFIAALKKETAAVGASTADKKQYEAEQIAGQMRLAGIRDDVTIRFLNSMLKEVAALEKAEEAFKAAAQADARRIARIDNLNNELNLQAEAGYEIALSTNAYVEAVRLSNEYIALEISLLGASDVQRQIALANRQIDLDLKRQEHEINMTLATDADKAAQLELARQAAASAKVASTAGIVANDDYKQIQQAADDARNAWKKAGEDIQRSLTGAFGKAGDAIGKMASIYGSFVTAQLNAEKKIADAKKTGDVTKIIKAEIDAREESAKNQIGMYADMAGAAKGFFEEGSKGYKALQVAEQTFRLFEMALSLEAFLRKTGFITAEASIFATGVATKTAAAQAGGAVEVMTNMQVGASAAVAGVANQSGGDPYSAFFRIAAMAAIMAGLGFAVGGGGGGGSPPVDIAKQRQEKQGTGSVFGDDSAKSESIAKSIELLSKNSDITLTYSNQMLGALIAIRDNILGLVNAVVRTTGLRGGPQDIAGLGIGSSKGALGFSSSSTELVDQGIRIGVQGTQQVAHTIPGYRMGGESELEMPESTYYTTENTFTPQTIGAVRAAGSLAGSKYSQTHSEESSWWGLSQSETDSTIFKDLDKSVQRQMGLTVISIANGVEAAAGALGMGGEEVRKKIDAFNVDIGLISLKGLKGQELQDELNAVFSKFGDDLALSVLPGLDDFQKVGEGYFETLVRVATGIEQAKGSLEKFGITAIDFKDIVNKQGEVMAEIFRQSVVKAETGVSTTDRAGVTSPGAVSGIGQIIDNFTGSGADMIELYSTLVGIRTEFKAFGAQFQDVTIEMIKGAGSLDELKKGVSDFFSLFYSEAEQTAAQGNKLTDTFAGFGKELPTTREGFRSMIEGQEMITESGQKLYGQMIANAGAVDEYIAALEQLSASFVASMAELRGTQPGDTAQGAFDGSILALQKIAPAITDFNALLSMTQTDFENYSPVQREAINLVLSNAVALKQYNEELEKSTQTYEMAVAKHNGATEQQMTEMTQHNALAKVTALGINNMAEATNMAYVASLNLTPAQLELVTAYINTDDAVQNLTDSIDSMGISMGQVAELAMSAFDQMMADFKESAKTIAAGDFGKELTLTAGYLSEQIGVITAARDAMLARQGGMSYGDTDQVLTNEIVVAQAKLAELTQDYLRYVALESQYAGHGQALLELEKTYEAQRLAMSGNNAALLALEQAYGIRRNAIINGTLTSGLMQQQESLRKWLQGLTQSAALSPLTAQQQLDAANALYAQDLAKAQGGDAAALAALTKDADALLAAQKAVSGFGGDYSALFAMVRQNIADLAGSNIDGTTPPPTVIAPASFETTNAAIAQTTQAAQETAAAVKEVTAELVRTRAELARLAEQQVNVSRGNAPAIVAAVKDAGADTSAQVRKAAVIFETH